MPATPTIFERPQRWDAAFDADMTEADVERLLATAPFSGMDAEKFPKRTPLREILRNDARILKFRKGEIIVRQGDYGTSAFLILKGAARVVLNSAFLHELREAGLTGAIVHASKSGVNGAFCASISWGTWRPKRPSPMSRCAASRTPSAPAALPTA